ncbi:TPA: hypothetical protein ACGFXS_003220, partial [Vibrio cholerae]
FDEALLKRASFDALFLRCAIMCRFLDQTQSKLGVERVFSRSLVVWNQRIALTEWICPATAGPLSSRSQICDRLVYESKQR